MQAWMNPCWLVYFRFHFVSVAMFVTCAVFQYLQQHYWHLGDATSPTCYITNSITGTTANLTGKELWILWAYVCVITRLCMELKIEASSAQMHLSIREHLTSCLSLLRLVCSRGNDTVQCYDKNTQSCNRGLAVKFWICDFTFILVNICGQR